MKTLRKLQAARSRIEQAGAKAVPEVPACRRSGPGRASAPSASVSSLIEPQVITVCRARARVSQQRRQIFAEQAQGTVPEEGPGRPEAGAARGRRGILLERADACVCPQRRRAERRPDPIRSEKNCSQR